MLIKSFLLISIIISCALIGEEIYKFYKRRFKDISDLIKLVEMLNMELRFGLYTLSELFRSCGEKEEFSVHIFFKQVSIFLEENKTLEDSIQMSMPLVKKYTNLDDDVCLEMTNLALNMGKSDFEGQQRLVDLCVENLKVLRDQMHNDVNQKGLLYKKISFVSGLLIAIILI